jgi:hypothetical protein
MTREELIQRNVAEWKKVHAKLSTRDLREKKDKLSDHIARAKKASEKFSLGIGK